MNFVQSSVVIIFCWQDSFSSRQEVIDTTADIMLNSVQYSKHSILLGVFIFYVKRDNMFITCQINNIKNISNVLNYRLVFQFILSIVLTFGCLNYLFYLQKNFIVL